MWGSPKVQLTNKRTPQMKHQLKESNKNGGFTMCGVVTPTSEKSNKMSLATMIASAERLSKNLERKMVKPIIKKESNNKPIKKSLKMADPTAVLRRSVLEETKTISLVPLTSEPRLEYQCIREDVVSDYTPSKNDVAVQTEPQYDTSDIMQKTHEASSVDHNSSVHTLNTSCLLCQQQAVEMGSGDGQPFSCATQRKTLKNYVRPVDKFLGLNMKTPKLLKKHRVELTAPTVIVADVEGNGDHWKFINNFIWFSIGVITTYVVNYGLHYMQSIKYIQCLLE